MKLRVSSGRSLDVAYLSTVAEPAQQPGLETQSGRTKLHKLQNHANYGFLTTTSARLVCFVHSNEIEYDVHKGRNYFIFPVKKLVIL